VQLALPLRHSAGFTITVTAGVGWQDKARIVFILLKDQFLSSLYSRRPSGRWYSQVKLLILLSLVMSGSLPEVHLQCYQIQAGMKGAFMLLAALFCRRKHGGKMTWESRHGDAFPCLGGCMCMFFYIAPCP
jgi:hypothetical protein